MFNRRWIVAAVVVLGAVLLPPVAPAEARSPNLVRGTLYDADGKVAAGAEVVVAAFPRADAAGVIEERVLAATMTDAAGAFQVVVPPPVGASFRGPGNSVELVFHVRFADGTGFWHFVPASPPSGGVGGWSWLDSATTPAPNARRAGSPPLTLGAPAAARARHVSAREDDNPDAPLGTFTPRALPACPYTTYGMRWQSTGVWSRRQVPIQRVRTRTRSKVDYNWSTTNNTMMDIAVTSPSAVFSAGLTYSQTNGTTGGMDPASGNSTSQLYTQEWQYNQYQLHCLNASAQWIPQDTYQWIPNNWTLGNDKRAVGDRWQCTQNNTVTIASATWAAKYSSVVYGGWFSIGGATLSSKQTNSSAHKMTYTPTAGKAKICGSNGTPDGAAQVAEAVW